MVDNWYQADTDFLDDVDDGHEDDDDDHKDDDEDDKDDDTSGPWGR